MELTIEQALQKAVESHKAGKLQDAESLYRAILQKQPKHPDANHNLGVIAVSLNKTDIALPLFQTALEANPKQGQFWMSYVDALIKERQFDNARSVLERGRKLGLAGEKVDALQAYLIQLDSKLESIRPGENKLSMAIVHRETGRYQEAQDWLIHFLSDAPNDAEAWSLLSQVYLLDNKYAEAGKALSNAISINEDLPSIYRNQARILLKESKPAEALLKAQSAYEKSIEDPESWLILASCLVANQRDAEALTMIEGALKARPNYAEAFAIRAMVRERFKDTIGAIKDAEKAVSLKPYLTKVWGYLGSLHQKSNNLIDAIQALKRASENEPANVNYLSDLGELLRQASKIHEAIDLLERATQLAPENSKAWTNLGVSFQAADKLEQAKEAYHKALVIDPQIAEISNNLGVISNEQGHWAAALKYYEQAIKDKPNFPEALNNMGATLKKTGRVRDAETSYRKSIALKPGYAVAHGNLGFLQMVMHQYLDAMESIRHALEINPKLTAALQGYSVLLAYTSNFRDVCKISDDALNFALLAENKKQLLKIWEMRLFTWIYHPDLLAQEICEEHIKWGSTYAHLGKAGFASHDRTPGRKLKIGYVSPDFRGHTCRFYFEPLFASHDHTQFELFAYANVQIEDEHTHRMKPYFNGWRNILGMSDEAAAEMIRRDQIDILIDGCGHMEDTRLTVFAHKPAPVQVTWLGSAWTTGLPQMDYVLFDPYMAPAGTATSEKIVHLPRTWASFRPGDVARQCEVAPTPALRNGYVTFGYTGRTERLNHRVFHAWARILKRLPQACLILDYKPFGDPKTQAYYREFLQEHGVDTTRVVMRNSKNIFESLGDIDILLDSFPHSGGTMLFDAVWMGVPAVTLASDRPVGRIGTSLMSNLGLAAWVSQTEQEYEDKAVAFAQDIPALANLRSTMRPRMQASPVMDEQSFARDVENAYKEMWRNWLVS